MKGRLWFTISPATYEGSSNVAKGAEQGASAAGRGAAEQHTAGTLFPLVYEELRAYAHRLFQRRQAGRRTLQPTAVVHEVFLRLASGKGSGAGQEGRHWATRTHFFSTAARAMRMVMADYARRQNALKRGGAGGWERVTLELAVPSESSKAVDILALDQALERLEALDERQAKIVELRLFGGMTMEEIAQAVGVSKRTAELDWRMARAWLEAELRETD